LRRVNRVVQQPIQGFLAALGAVAVLSIMDAVMKHLVLALGIIAISMWRAIVNMAISVVLYLPRRREWPSPKTIKFHVARGILVAVLAFLFFWGIGRVPLAQAIALTFIGPLIALLLAAFFLHEKIGPRSIVGSIGAFAGVVVIMFGQAQAKVGPEVLLGTAAILCSAACYAVNIVMMRHQARIAEPLEINFFQSLTVLGVWLFVMPVAGLPAAAHGQWVWIAVASFLSTIGTLLYGWGYARGPASYLAVTEYSGFLWASACGWLIFQERVSLFTLAGAVLIVGGCLLAARGRVAEPPEIDVAA
jgi:S-adenosylmethionine uptake transporter